MPTPMPAAAVLDREFLEIRAKILQIAASLDRLDRGDGDVRSDARYQQLLQGLEVLGEPDAGRAERVQTLFSLAYDADWRDTFGIQSRS